MEVVVDKGNSAYKCGCDKIYPTLKSWTGHLARGRTDRCSSEPILIVNLPDPPDEGDDFSPEIPADQLETPATTTRAGRAGAKVEDPIPAKGRAAIMGELNPSTLKESLSFPVYSRVMYDAWRQYYGTKRTFNEWINLCLLAFWKQIGLQLSLTVLDDNGQPQQVEFDVGPDMEGELQ